MIEHHRRLDDTGVLVFPLVFGENLVGFMVLSFKRAIDQQLRESEVLVGLSHAATIAIEFARRTDAARDVAVLAERNRIAQEIHDGIAQAFTGILLQLGAVEPPRRERLRTARSAARRESKTSRAKASPKRAAP